VEITTITIIIIITIITWSRALLEKLIVSHLVYKLVAYYGIQKLIIVFTDTATGTYPEPDKSTPHAYVLFLQVVLLGIDTV